MSGREHLQPVAIEENYAALLCRTGMSWRNISDGFFGGSIGAVDIADSDPNVIYVGTGCSSGT